MKRLLLTICTLFILFTPALVLSGPAAAASDCGSSDPNGAKQQVLNGIGQTTSDCTGNGVSNTVGAVVDILSYVVGIIAVIAIISAGFKYVTSGGEAGKVGNAKSTIMYALVGVVIVVLAQLIVRFTITQSAKAANGDSTAGQSQTQTGGN